MGNASQLSKQSIKNLKYFFKNKRKIELGMQYLIVKKFIEDAINDFKEIHS